MTRWIGGLVALLAAALGVACGGGSNMMGSGMNGSGGTGASGGAAFMSVSPMGWATGIAVGSPITFRFGGAMGGGMMGSGWRNANGSYGMVFGFTTA